MLGFGFNDPWAQKSDINDKNGKGVLVLMLEFGEMCALDFF